MITSFVFFVDTLRISIKLALGFDYYYSVEILNIAYEQ